MILTTTIDALHGALRAFDADHRPKAEWKNWDKKRSQKYALTHAGQTYPPKKVVSLATGLDVNSFYGGRPTNSLLEKHGFTILPLQHDKAPAAPIQIPCFQFGKSYTRKGEITGKFGGSGRSGIAPSSQSPAIFIFTGESGEAFGYLDHFDDDGNLIYVGEGQERDMVMTRGNLAITRHAQDGRALHVFKSIGNAKYSYLGEFFYGSHDLRRGADKKGNDREIIVFCLVPVGATLTVEQPLAADVGATTPRPATGPDLGALRTAAIEATTTAAGASKSSTPKVGSRTIYERSQKVKDYVIARANGDCELCDKPAPFQKADGTPYLEPHHINRLSDGGLDHPFHVGAICPNCHQHIHHGKGGTSLNNELRERVRDKEVEITAGVTV